MGKASFTFLSFPRNFDLVPDWTFQSSLARIMKQSARVKTCTFSSKQQVEESYPKWKRSMKSLFKLDLKTSRAFFLFKMYYRNIK